MVWSEMYSSTIEHYVIIINKIHYKDYKILLQRTLSFEVMVFRLELFFTKMFTKLGNHEQVTLSNSLAVWWFLDIQTAMIVKHS